MKGEKGISIKIVIDGETSVFKKVRTRKKAIDEIVEDTLSDIENGGLGSVIGLYVGPGSIGIAYYK